MKPALEKDLVKGALQLLRSRGCFCWRANSGAIRVERGGRQHLYRFAGVEGLSDIVGVLPGGKFISVELKRAGNKATPHQAAFLAAVEAHGGVALLVSDLAALDLALAAALAEGKEATP
jgi:hypothetical protein